jgi:rare lipoprotein A
MRRIYISFIAILCLFLTFQNVSAAVFSDVASDNPNFTAINYLHDSGVIEGYSDNTFRPNQKVNRAEALKIILLGAGVLVPEIQSQEIFPDVLSDAWYAKYVMKAKNLDIVKGDGGTGFFRPGDTVNLAEALKILLKAGNKNAPTPSGNPYLDVPADAWFAPYFEYARLARLLDESSKENVNPSAPVTRGMLAEMMYRLKTTTYIVPDGTASYYGADFHGKTTSSGEIFDASGFTAAHRTYPFGTWLKVTNTANGKSVVVRVNDRGPYTKDPNRIIDLSQAAFESIASLSSGVISVKIEQTTAPSATPAIPADTTTNPTIPVTQPTTTANDLVKGDLLNSDKVVCPDTATLEFISKDAFTNIKLDNEIPNRILLSEVLTLTGSASSSAANVSAFIVDSDNIQTAFSGDITGGRFSINVRFPKEGTYKLGILPGDSGESIIKEIKVQKNTCIEEMESSQLTAPTGLDVSLKSGETLVSWNADKYNLFKLTFSQDGLHRTYILKNLTSITPFIKEFAAFKAANVDISLRGTNLTTKSILEPAQIIWSPAATKGIIANPHDEYIINKKEVEIISLTDNSIINGEIKAVFKPKVSVRSQAAVILPNGKVKNISLTSDSVASTKNAFDIDVFPSGSTLTASYTAESTGIHFLEINNAEGLAVINVPIYIKNQFPLIPTARDLSDGNAVDLGTDLPKLRNQFLTLVNADRKQFGLNSLALDDSLSNLAQYRSDDMVAKNYFSHWDKQGRDANDLRLNYGIQTLVGENIAKDITLDMAEYGLMRSAIHRSNLLSPDWTRVGFGITRLADGSYIFVQIFSENPLDMSDITGLRNSILTKINANRASGLVLADNLTSIAQTWSEKMVSEDFFDFTDKNGVGLVDNIHNAGVTASLGTYIMGNSSFGDVLSQVSANTQISDSKWKNIGIGIKQDNLGIIKVTLIYTE